MQGRKASIEGRPMKGRERSGSEPIKDFIASKFCNPARKKSFLDMVVDTKVTIKSDLENIEGQLFCLVCQEMLMNHFLKFSETPSFKFISHLPLVIETIKGQSTTFTCRLSHSDAPLKWFFCGQEVSSFQSVFSW